MFLLLVISSTKYQQPLSQNIYPTHLTFVYIGSVSCSKPLRASKICSFIQKKRLQKNESMLDSPVPLLGFALQLLLGSFHKILFLQNHKMFVNNVSVLLRFTVQQQQYIGSLFWYISKTSSNNRLLTITGTFQNDNFIYFTSVTMYIKDSIFLVLIF
ncbi:Hypothetical_protein [Hexamita inflata]|uniref:Hypothetical_protein n=1 Tax=Hexamita inflata TaxID=28002 RepID=A0AA86NPR6_9EUKA|nr:Hypothetical protein HINF_LOCUS10361 [Hexamita inflata]